MPPTIRDFVAFEEHVEGIGTIRNQVAPGAELPPVPGARPRPRARERSLW